MLSSPDYWYGYCSGGTVGLKCNTNCQLKYKIQHENMIRVFTARLKSLFIYSQAQTRSSTISIPLGEQSVVDVAKQEPVRNRPVTAVCSISFSCIEFESYFKAGDRKKQRTSTFTKFESHHSMNITNLNTSSHFFNTYNVA